jgi:hypothetical protein
MGNRRRCSTRGGGLQYRKARISDERMSTLEEMKILELQTVQSLAVRKCHHRVVKFLHVQPKLLVKGARGNSLAEGFRTYTMLI